MAMDFDIAVIGGGAVGLSVAAGAAELGLDARLGLIDPDDSTLAQINRWVADERLKAALTPARKRWLKRLFGLRGAA